MSHKIFDDVEERGRGERKRLLLRETTTSWAKQRPMRQLHNYCMSCCCHATHNISFLYAQIKEFYYSTRRLIRQLIVQVLYWVNPILRVNVWGDLSDDTNVLALRFRRRQSWLIDVIDTSTNFELVARNKLYITIYNVKRNRRSEAVTTINFHKISGTSMKAIDNYDPILFELIYLS
jgi:hypothetical protein